MDISLQTLEKRFRDYISFDTQSDENETEKFPSTSGQKVFAKHLAEELTSLGLTDVSLDDHGYVMASLPATDGESAAAPVVGFISHMDTSPDAAGGPVKARRVEYEGGDIVLNEDAPGFGRVVLSPQDFPELADYVGQPILVTDGTTLLGADDKAGITAIVSAAEYLLQHKELKHGTIKLAFTPEEETGRGVKYFDVDKFGADFAYTVDGGALGGLEYENFNAANVKVTFHGRSVHTGDAKNKMKNALTIASEWQQMLPAGERPEYTEGHEGFFHVHTLQGNVETAVMGMLIRDHDRAKFEQRKQYLTDMADLLNAKYGAGTVEVDAKDVYYNMLEKIKPHMELVELARQAMREADVEPAELPIRGGTDGAMLSWRGLPCPNLFTGGLNYHGRYEYLPLLSLQKAAAVVLNIMMHTDELHK